jgi:hypothetical protein
MSRNVADRLMAAIGGYAIGWRGRRGRQIQHALLRASRHHQQRQQNQPEQAFHLFLSGHRFEAYFAKR